MARRRTQTRQRLLDAAYTVFAERGFGHATVEDVCAAAGFTRGAFYSSFTSLDELFFALYRERAASLVAQVTQALADPSELPDDRSADGNAEGSAEALERLVRRVLDALGSDRRWFAVNTEFLVHSLRHPELAAELAEHRRALREALTPALVAASAWRRLPVASSTPQLLARTLVALYEGTTIAALVEPECPDVRDWQSSVLLLAVGAPAPSAADPPQVRSVAT